MKISKPYNYLMRSLQVKTLFFFQCVVIVGGLVALTLGIILYGRTILQQAQDKVKIDLNSARMVYNGEIKDLETIVYMTSERFFLKEGITNSQFKQVEKELERVQIKNGLDFLTLTDNTGRVILRAQNPSVKGDDQSNDEMVRSALKKKTISGTQIIPREELLKEGDELARQAFMACIPTEKSKPRVLDQETSGMILKAAAPVMDENGNLLGVLYGGKMLNRNYEIVDRIKGTVFGGEKYRRKDVGTATIFQWDLRISTNVRTSDETRAIGTLVSSDVYERVLENGLKYIGRAFVVNAYYITAYEPIHDVGGKIIGILYVGTLEQPFLDIRNEVIFAFLGIAILGVLITFVLSFFLTRSITRPISKLANATRDISKGHFPPEILVDSRDEIGHLANSFNQMSRDLRKTMEEKDAINKNLKELNQRYLELLGFTTHELKQPIEVLNGYLVMLQDESIGKLSTPQQHEAISDMLTNVNLMTDMIQKYLQLSKIESGELTLIKNFVRIYPDIIQPVLKGEEQQIAIKKLTLTFENQEAIEDLEVEIDPVLIRIVFSNLINNAIKYGKKGGVITIGYQREEGFHRFHVKNDGQGIPQNFLNRVFEKFMRVKRGKTGRIMGTGLGLYNSKVIVEEHGGKIWAESEEGKWADFIFLIPET